jgi:hypothetical protein
VERGDEVLAELTRPRIEWDVARHPDGARDEFFSGAGRSGDERRDVRHAIEQRASITHEVVREDRLPDRPTQARGGERAADQELVDVDERAVQLEEEREEMLELFAVDEANARHS